MCIPTLVLELCTRACKSTKLVLRIAQRNDVSCRVKGTYRYTLHTYMTMLWHLMVLCFEPCYVWVVCLHYLTAFSCIIVVFQASLVKPFFQRIWLYYLVTYIYYTKLVRRRQLTVIHSFESSGVAVGCGLPSPSSFVNAKEQQPRILRTTTSFLPVSAVPGPEVLSSKSIVWAIRIVSSISTHASCDEVLQ